MRLRGIMAGTFACLLLLPATAVAQSPAVANAVSQDSRLPAVQTAAQAESNWKALRGAVIKAIVEGHGKELFESGKPNILGALLRYGHVKSSITRSERTKLPKEANAPTKATAENNTANAASVKAHTAQNCYGSPSTQYNWTAVWGGTIAWVYVRANGWCGIPGVQITWNGGATFTDWQAPGMCLFHHQTNWSWDQYPRWIHGANWGSLGPWYPTVGCLTGIKGGKTVIRIAANGYWDNYNDYGF